LSWLIAEDETDIRNLVAMMCRVWGHETLVFEDGQKVWDWLDEVEAGVSQTNIPEFALLDIRMPGKRGDEVMRRMRTLPQFADIPIVLMTAFALSDAEKANLVSPNAADHILGKPLPDFESLRTLLHDILAKKQVNPESYGK